MTKHTLELEIEHHSLSTAAEPAAAVVVRKSGLRRALIAGGSLLALAGAVYAGWGYWTVGRFEVSTDDAYVQADNTTVAPKVSGYLETVLVNDNDTVHAGQVLAHIDDRDFRTALDQARANVAAAEAVIEGDRAALVTQQSVIASARATIAADAASQVFAAQEDRRYSTLAQDGWGSAQNAQQAASRNAASRAFIARDTAALATAVKQLDSLRADLARAQAALAQDRAAERQAVLNLSYTTIVAAVDGVAGNRTLRVGQYVQAGTQLMAVVPVQAAYIVANYKETQLASVHAGQPVDVAVDMFPGVVAHGHVDSLAPGSGQEFALLPPDNATGNFTKIVQRIPVKIVLDPGSPLTGLLKPGMSVAPAIMTKPVLVTRAASVATAPAHAG